MNPKLSVSPGIGLNILSYSNNKTILGETGEDLTTSEESTSH